MRPLIPAHILDEVRLKRRLRRRWQVTRSPAPKTEVNRLQGAVTAQLNEWRNGRWNSTLETLDPEDQSLWRMNKRVISVPTLSPPLVTPGGTALSNTEKSEALTDNLEAQFQPVTAPSEPGFIEMVEDELLAFSHVPSLKPILTNPTEVREALRGVKADKAPGPDGIRNRALKQLQNGAVSLIVTIFNAMLLIQYFPTAWRHERVVSFPKPDKDP